MNPKRHFTPAQERGIARLHNWALWSRLDSADTGYPSRCSYYTPPRSGDIFDGPTDEANPDIDYRDAEIVEALVVRLSTHGKIAVKMRYLNRAKIIEISIEIDESVQKTLDVLAAVEKELGHG